MSRGGLSYAGVPASWMQLQMSFSFPSLLGCVFLPMSSQKGLQPRVELGESGDRGDITMMTRMLAGTLLLCAGVLLLELDITSAAFHFNSAKRFAPRKSLTSRRAQDKNSFYIRSGREPSPKEVHVRKDSFTFSPAYVPADAMNDVQEQLLRLREEREAEVRKVKAEKEANLKAMRQESEEALARMRMEYEGSAAAWDRKLRQMADTLENQRGACHTHELELHAVKTELEARRAEIHNLESDCLTLEGQVESNRATIMNLEAARREQGLRIKELEYEVEYTEDQFAQENRIVRMRDSRIRELEKGLVDAACVQSSLNTPLLFLYSRVAELEATLHTLTQQAAQGRAAEERLRRDLLAATDRHESDVKVMQATHADLTSQLTEARGSIVSLRELVGEREAANHAQQVAIAAADRSIAALQDQIASDKAVYEDLQAQLREIHGEHYEVLKDLQAAKAERAQGSTRVERLLSELQSERQLRLKDNEVWKAAVAKAEAAQRAAEQTVDALEARLQSIEQVEEERKLALVERGASARRDWGRVLRRSLLVLGVAGAGAAPGLGWWAQTIKPTLCALNSATGGHILAKGKPLRVALGVVMILLLTLARARGGGRTLMARGQVPELNAWNTSGPFLFAPRG